MKLIAHACGPTLYPSNTIFSAREALKNGADLVELDLQYTSDQRLAVFHDKDLMKKYGDPRRCCEVTAEEFLSLRLKKDPACPSHLLDHFFRCEIAPILLHHSYRVLESVVDLVEEYGYEDRVTFGITEARSLVRIRERLPESKVLGFIHGPENIEEFARHGVNYIRLWERWMTPENVARVKSAGVELWVMTGGPETECKVGFPNEESLKRVVAMEPDGLLVNDLPFVKSVLASL